MVAVTAALTGLALIYGQIILSRPITGSEIKVSVVQGNIAQEKKWDKEYANSIMQIYADLTREASKAKPALIVWPETATPCYLMKQKEYYQKVRDLVDELGIPVLTGSPDYVYRGGEEYQYFNSAFYFVPGTPEIQRY